MAETDPNAAHLTHWYVRERVYRALRCLIGAKPFRERLAAAASCLSDLEGFHSVLLDRLPEDVRRKFDGVMEALAKHPPEWKGLGAHEASACRLTPRQRAKIAQDVLDIYVAVSGGL
jgi:hypothetical protein